MASPANIVTEDVVTEDVMTEPSRTEAAGDVTSPSPADVDESHLDSGSTHLTTSDRNSVVLVGRLATAPDIRSFASGTSLARLLVTVRSNNHRPRTDVLPVTVWEPDGLIRNAERGTRVSVEGTAQRRFWNDGGARRSRMEIVATAIEVAIEGDDE